MDTNLWNLEKEMAKRTIKQYCSSWSELRYDEIRNKPYFIGKRTKDAETETIFPINSNKILTFNQLKAGITDSGSSAVNLAIYGSDSTVVQYKAHLGLKPPFQLPDPEKYSEDESTKKRKRDVVEEVDDDELSVLSAKDVSTKVSKNETSDSEVIKETFSEAAEDELLKKRKQDLVEVEDDEQSVPSVKNNVSTEHSNSVTETNGSEVTKQNNASCSAGVWGPLDV